MPDREEPWPWCRPARDNRGPGRWHRAALRPRGPPAVGAARGPAPRAAGRPLGHPGGGGADDARCRGRRTGDAPGRLRRGGPGPRADADGRDRADGRAGPGALPRTGRRRAPWAWWPSAATGPPCPAPGSPCREPTTQLQAHVRNVAQWAELRAAERQRFCARLAAAVGQEPTAVEADLERGRFLGAEEAVEYGILDEVLPTRRPDPAAARIRAAADGFSPAALTGAGPR